MKVFFLEYHTDFQAWKLHVVSQTCLRNLIHEFQFFFRNDKIIEPIKQSNRYTQVVCRGLWSFPARLSLLDSDYTSLCSILQLWKLLNMSPFLFVVKATLKPPLSSPSEKALTTKCTASRAYSKHWTPFSFRSVDLSKQKKITLNRGALNCFGIMTFGYL